MFVIIMYAHNFNDHAAGQQHPLQVLHVPIVLWLCALSKGHLLETTIEGM